MTGIIAFALGNWRLLLPLLIIAGLAIDDGIHRIEASSCHEARAADKVAAEKAKAEAIQHAQETSDRIITEQAQAIAATANRAAPVVERIIHAPVTSGCGPVMRDAARGVRDILNSSGGEAKAGGNAPAAVPAAPDRGGR